MPQTALVAIGGGVLSALATVAMLGGSSLAVGFIYLAPLPLYLVGFWQGQIAATIAILSGLVLVTLLGGELLAGMFALMCALPVWLVVRQVSLSLSGGINNPAGGALAFLGLVGAGAIGLAAVFLSGSGIDMMSNETGDVMASSGFRDTIVGILNQVFTVVIPELQGEHRVLMVERLAPMFPGTMVASWMLMTVFNAAIAQGMLAKSGHSLRPSPVYADMDLPLWLSWPLVGAAAIAVSGSMFGMEDVSYIGRNLVMAVAVAYFFQGLAVVHSLARLVPFPGTVLAGLYVVLLFSGWAAMVVAGIGIIEQWIGLRDRFLRN